MLSYSFSPPYEEPVPDTFGKGQGVVGPEFFSGKNIVKIEHDPFEPPLPSADGSLTGKYPACPVGITMWERRGLF
jgi:hypothetical protein